jgi:hypothetical protein
MEMCVWQLTGKESFRGLRAELSARELPKDDQEAARIGE